MLANLNQTDQPLGFDFVQAMRYAKNAGGLLLVRPRVLGVKADGILETSEPRRFPIECEGPVEDTDTLRSRCHRAMSSTICLRRSTPISASRVTTRRPEVKDNVIGYTRTFEVKELSVPVSKADDLEKFYQIIAGDERNTAVLKLTK